MLNTKRGIRLFSQKNLYSSLGVTPDATSTEIKIAYYKLAQKFHPDKSTENSHKRRFEEIGKAYETLSDPELKQKYDFENNFKTSQLKSSTKFENQQSYEYWKNKSQSGQAQIKFEHSVKGYFQWAKGLGAIWVFMFAMQYWNLLYEVKKTNFEDINQNNSS